MQQATQSFLPLLACILLRQNILACKSIPCFGWEKINLYDIYFIFHKTHYHIIKVFNLIRFTVTLSFSIFAPDMSWWRGLMNVGKWLMILSGVTSGKRTYTNSLNSRENVFHLSIIMFFFFFLTLSLSFCCF